MFKVFKKKKAEGIHIGKGYSLDDHEKLNFLDIFQKDANRRGHTIVFGTTRVGKTRLVENGIIQDIENGKNVIIIDPKIDIDLFSRVFQVASSCGRENEITLINSLTPDLSAKINPLANFHTPEEPISHIMSTVPSTDEFFYNVAYDTTTVIVRGIIKVREDEGFDKYFTFNDFMKWLPYGKFTELRDRLLKFEDTDSKIIVGQIEDILDSGPEYFNKVSKTLKSAIMQLSLGNTAEVVSRSKNNDFLNRLEEGKGAILYVQSAALLQPRASFMLGRVIISMIQSLVGRFYASGKKFERPLVIYGDEFSNIVYNGIDDMFNKAGGCNCYIVALTQSPADIVAVIGEDKARKIFDNTNTKIFMRINDISSAKMLTTYGGTMFRNTVQLNLHGGLRGTEVEEDVIRETDLLRLEKREFYYFGFEGIFKGKTDPLGEPDIKILLPNIIRNARKEND
ncbi:MAG: conjugal transfer protein TraD [Arcobacter sp.]|nr:conjugal transfer protein TraD [Arcobacter sp.]|tara:strand:- start:7399 stop:8757 length:1359 start_codon:yes stop_codon:yes gene_type:complete